MPNSLHYSVDSGYGLGDLFAALYLFENVGRQHNLTFQFCLPSKWRSVTNVLRCHRIEFVTREGKDLKAIAQSVKPRCKYKWLHCGDHEGFHFVSLLLELVLREYDFNRLVATPIQSIYERVAEEVVLVQFDGRTIARQGRDIGTDAKMNFIRRWTDDWVVIGGEETPHYIDASGYRLGSLSYIIEQLVNCRLFIGCDSGISHLAGALGVSCKVLVLGSCFRCLSKFYQIYSQCELFSNTAFKRF